MHRITYECNSRGKIRAVTGSIPNDRVIRRYNLALQSRHKCPFDSDVAGFSDTAHQACGCDPLTLCPAGSPWPRSETQSSPCNEEAAHDASKPSFCIHAFFAKIVYFNGDGPRHGRHDGVHCSIVALKVQGADGQARRRDVRSANGPVLDSRSGSFVVFGPSKHAKGFVGVPNGDCWGDGVTKAEEDQRSVARSEVRDQRHGYGGYTRP
jgi:hypothetical protein